MTFRRTATLLALVAAMAACADTVAPPPAEQPTMHMLRWALGAPPQFVATLSDPTGRLQLSAGATAQASVTLSANQLSFWARRGETRTLAIDYLTSTGPSPFLRLTVSDPVYQPGRGSLAVGDSVLITATVDPQTLSVGLEPHGLLFGTASPLKLWYTGAGGDLNTDGAVNSVDSNVEQTLLGLWWQADTSSPWVQISAIKNTQEKSLQLQLEHFSGYAISW